MTDASPWLTRTRVLFSSFCISTRKSLALFGAVWLAAGAHPLVAGSPSKSPYGDLLPANAVLKDSPDRLDPVVLSRSTLGVVASSRYVADTARWQRIYGEKGDRAPHGLAAIMGVTAANKKLDAEAADPKRFADAALLQLRPRFAAVKMFDDLAAARDGGASYFLVLDFHQSVLAGFFGATGVHGQAGALLLDGPLRRVAEVSVDRKTKWFSAPLLGMANAEFMADAKSHDENFKVLLSAFTDALNSALTEHGSPMPVTAGPTPVAAVVAAAPTPAPAPVDQAYLAELAAIPTAGALYALGDEMAEKGERAKAAAAFRAVLTRFPNDALAAEAAHRLGNTPR